MLNALDASNYFQFNISAAQILGLFNAIYCSEIINIYQKAEKKKKLYDGFFIVKRDYITKRTTLDLTVQYECDAALQKVGIIKISKDNPDMINLDYEKFVQIVTNEDYKSLKEISKKARILTPSDVKEAKKKKIKENLQAKVCTGNGMLDEALRNWIDVTFEKTVISNATVIDFQNVLMQYIKVDVKKGLRIIEIATAQAWTSCVQAIESYEKEQEVLTKVRNQPRVTNIKRGSVKNLSEEVY